MAKNTFKIEGVEKAIEDIRKAGIRKRGELVKAIGATVIMGHADMVRTLSIPGTSDNVYGKHRASKEGEPPAPDTGQYRASWHPVLDWDGLGGALFTNDKRATWLEKGTPRMGARPHAGPVAERLKTTFVNNVKRYMTE
jgi:hypothetical protein